MPAPTVSTEWASSLTALSLEPTAVHNDRGWDTDDGTVQGVPEKPTLQHQNAWQKNVHEWLQFANENLSIASRLPIGTIIPVASNLSGSYTIPSTGIVTNGWMLCDGAVIPAIHTLSGSTPNLTGDVFLQGSLIAGGSGGGNSKTLSTSEMPSHRHGPNTYASSRGGTFSSTTHNHNLHHTQIAVPFTITGTTAVNARVWWRSVTIPTWTANFYSRQNHAGTGSFAGSWSLEISGRTEGASSSSGIGGSNTVTGTSGPYGSGSSIDIRSLYLTTQYLIKVSTITTRPTVSTEWANGATAIQSQPTAEHIDRGWDTDTGDINGTPQKPSLEILNGWRKNVHVWLQYIVDITDHITLIPTGSIISIDTSIVGSYTIPGPGVVTDGWMLCDNSVIPGGQVLSGNTPDLTGDRFLMGSSIAGDTGGANIIALSASSTPTHDHGSGNYATSLSGTFASSTHTHPTTSNVNIPFNVSGNVRWRRSTTSPAWGETGNIQFGGITGFNTSTVSSVNQLDVSGNTGAPKTTASLTGSSNIGGTSSSFGSGSVFDIRPRFISCQYLIKVI